MEFTPNLIASVLSRSDAVEIVDPSKTSDSPTAKLCYYLYCVNTAVPNLQLKISESVVNISEFAHWNAPGRYTTSEMQKQLLEILEILYPKFFSDRGVFIETNSRLLRNENVETVPFKAVQSFTSVEIDEAIYVQGEQYDISHFVFFASAWLNEFYYEPIKSIKPANSNLGVSNMLLSPDLTPRKDVPVVLDTSRDTLKSSVLTDDQKPERDSALWYAFLTILSIIILIFVCVSNISEGVSAEDGMTSSDYTLWNVCVESELSNINKGCETYYSPKDLGIRTNSIGSHLTASRVLVSIYPCVGVIVLLASILRAWNRKSRRNTGRIIRAVIAVLHFSYLLITASVLTRFFNRLEDELNSLNGANESYVTSNGLGLLLPWAAWILSIFHTCVSIAWAVRALIKRGVAPV